jgi:hypothetical protein
VTQHSGQDRLHEQHGVSQTCGPQINHIPTAAMGYGTQGQETVPTPQHPQGTVSPEVKWPGREAASSSEVTNRGAKTPLHQTSSWHGA